MAIVHSTRVYNWYISMVAASCMVLYGYDASVYNSVQGSANWVNYFDKPAANVIGAVNTAYTVGAIVAGFFIGGPCADRFGRRWGMGIGCFLTIIATFIQTFAPRHNIGTFIAGRAIIGIGQGIALTAGPIYIGELTPPEIRGKVMSFWQLFYSVGSFLAYWINYACQLNVKKLGEWDWKIVVIFQIMVPVYIIILLPFIPETPRWYLQHGDRVADARATLLRVRETAQEVEDEILMIREALEFEKEAISSSYSALWKDPSVRKRLILAFILNAGQQVTGQGTLNTYSTIIYKGVFKSQSQISLINALNATFGIIFTLNATWTVDRFGRKFLFIVGAIGMAVCMLAVALVGTQTDTIYYMAKGVSKPTKEQPVGIAITFLLFLFIFFYKPSWGATTWIWTAEVFSMNVRAQAVGMASQTQNVANSIFQQFFPVFLQNCGFSTFYFFFAINVVLAVFVHFMIPETRRVSLEEMDTLFGGADHVEKGADLLQVEDAHHAVAGNNTQDNKGSGIEANEIEATSAVPTKTYALLNENMAREKTMDKAAYFKALNSLDEDSDDESLIESDRDGSTSLQPHDKLPPHKHHKPIHPKPNATPQLERSVSAPTPKSPSPVHLVKETPLAAIKNRLQQGRTGTPLSNEVSFVAETPTSAKPNQTGGSRPLRKTSAPTPTTLNRSAQFPSFSSAALGKRKRKEPSIKLVPEQHRIFNDMVFFYVPPDDIAPVRRARIVKAREYGATWSTEWTENVTHLVADKHLSYADITSFLKVSSIPDHIILVNELYPLDCIQFKAILNPVQKQYLLKGYEPTTRDSAPATLAQSPSSPVAHHSLELKTARPKPGRWTYVPPKATPPRSQSAEVRQSATPVAVEADDVARSPEHAEAAMYGTIGDEDTTEPLSARPVVESPKNLEEVSRADDDLDEIIKGALKVQHLPLDDDEDPSPTGSPYHGSDSSDDNGPSKPTRKYMTRKTNFNQEGFSCMKGGTTEASSSNPNARTISILQEMAAYYTRMDDTWRPIGYRKAITTLKRQNKLISTAEEAVKLPAIGQRIAEKIEEIVHTDKLRRLDNTKSDRNDMILQLFLGIYGVGIAQASTWLQQGYSTLEDLLAHASLTDNQRLGIEHYQDFQTRIPRAEVSALAKIITDTAKGINTGIEAIIAGSYRRGAESCGDIDVLLTKPGTSACSELAPLLYKLVSQLRASGMLVAPLSVGRTESSSKWHGCCVLPGKEPPIWRRIDFHLAPASELGAALLYFTGNDIFNRSIRLLASKRGMRLNQRGLYKGVMRGPGRVKLNEGELVEGADEKRIFAELGVPWRAPEERVC
ncbi:hypothetical protein V496_08955 [Pseudogymnoascus sp. VKM F-4515 (FW-2607)]|nr:hypothetical protein V496_08955 [Pseudogymnoascus sp. VKM F-4515 (FW-2607)]